MENRIMNPLAQTLSFVLKGNTGVHVLAYGDKHIFADLWGAGLESPTSKIDGQYIDWDDEKEVVLIVGEEPPCLIVGEGASCLSGINFHDHLTATSWAAAWRLKFPDAKARVVVVVSDLEGAGGLIARSLVTLFGARDANHSPLVPGVSLLRSPSLEVLCRTLGDGNGEVAKPAPTVQAMLRATLWDGLTSDREGHHAVSNILGALLLGSQFGRRQTHPGDPWPQDYLLSLVQACDVGATTNRMIVDDKQGFPCWASPQMQGAIGAAVLIDDMADIWGFFLRGALGFVGDANFQQSFVSSSRGKFADEISGLPDRLKAFLGSGGLFLSADVIISGNHSVKEDFALFLDLRLFPKGHSVSSAGSVLQGTFLKQLAEFGLALLDSVRKLPWLGEDGKISLRKEMEHLAAATSPDHSTSLEPVLPPEETLLPRLLSLLDPTLPIIIFSSTHCTDLIGPFRDYGNIITKFRKPILTSMNRDWSGVVKGLRADFVNALEQASGILKVRQAIHTFHQRVLPRGVLTKLPEGNDGYLVELFLDESEEPTTNSPPRAVCAGGIVVIRSLAPNGIPCVNDDVIFQKLKDAGCIWGWCASTPGDFTRPQRNGFLPKGEYLDFKNRNKGVSLLQKMVENVYAALGNTGCVFPFAVIGKQANPFPDWMAQFPDKCTVEKILDATLRRLVKHALEGLLFRSGVFRKALAHPKTRIAIDLGIRDYPCANNWPLFEAFGIEIRNRWRPSFHSEDGYIITSETIARTGMPWPFNARIVRARAVALKDFGSVVNRPHGIPLPRQLHYFSDAIAHVALHDLDVATKASGRIASFFEAGWITDFRTDSEAERRFAIGRALGSEQACMGCHPGR